MPSPSHLIPAALLDLLHQRPCVTVLIGAGTSAESGVPTFRQAQTGLWAATIPNNWHLMASYEITGNLGNEP